MEIINEISLRPEGCEGEKENPLSKEVAVCRRGIDQFRFFKDSLLTGIILSLRAEFLCLKREFRFLKKEFNL